MSKIVQLKDKNGEKLYPNLHSSQLPTNNLTFSDIHIFRNVDWNYLAKGIYQFNTWTGEASGKNSPGDNLTGTVIVTENCQIAFANGLIALRTSSGTNTYNPWHYFRTSSTS